MFDNYTNRMPTVVAVPRRASWHPLKVTQMEMDRKRSIVKTITWRVLATTDTFIIAFFVTYFVTGEAHPEIAASIAGIEVVTKIFLYYMHERAWAKSTYGVRPSRTPEKKAADLAKEAAAAALVVEQAAAGSVAAEPAAEPAEEPAAEATEGSTTEEATSE